VAGIHTREPGIIAGVEEASDLFTSLGLSVCSLVIDGTSVSAGALILEVEGEATEILLAERTALNIIGRMSGIATRTQKLVERVRAIDPRCRVSCTRKTAPGLRLMDKKAVLLGGGESHRFSLSDMFLIKDNHLSLISLDEAINRVRARSSYHLIEVEVTTPSMAEEAARMGVHAVMLDNMSPSQVAKTIRLLEKTGLRESLVLEVSGGISEANISAYAKLGVDVISMGSLTHSSPYLDVSLDVQERK
jgi:nicotinate-nucleotide pyrophosphorylase (carboxylating)